MTIRRVLEGCAIAFILVVVCGVYLFFAFPADTSNSPKDISKGEDQKLATSEDAGYSSEVVESTELSKEDQDFFDETWKKFLDAGINMFSIEELVLETSLDKVLELEDYIKSKEGFVFNSGAVFEKGSTYHIFSLIVRIRVHDLSGECQKVYELLPEFNHLITEDYLVISLFSGDNYDPVVNEDIYEFNKLNSDSILKAYLEDMKCYQCKIQPGPDWQLDESCFPAESDEHGSE